MSDNLHTLAVIGDPSDPHSDLYQYEIDCPGVTDACRMWTVCNVVDCPGRTGDDDTLYDVSNIAHGQPHRYIDDGWMVPTDTCYLIAADEMPDVAADMVAKESIGPGSYRVDHDFDDGRLSILALVGAAEAVSR